MFRSLSYYSIYNSAETSKNKTKTNGAQHFLLLYAFLWAVKTDIVSLDTLPNAKLEMETTPTPNIVSGS